MTAQRTGRRWRLGLAVALLTTVSAVAVPVTASAVGGFHTSAASVRVRAAATTGSAQTSLIAAAGTAIDIACQTLGAPVTAQGFGTSAIWDKLSGYGGGYISDLFVRETAYARFDPRIPRCDQIPPAQTAPKPAVPAPAAAPARPKADCSKVLFIGLRGSGELPGPEGLGDNGTNGENSPVQATRNRLAELGVRLDVAAVPGYYAQAVDVMFRPDLYAQSIVQGRDAALKALRARTDGNVCGWERTRAVLVGYSQGAYALGDAIEKMTPQERSTILGVVLYGNPRYTPLVNGAAGPALSLTGIAGPRPAYPDAVGQRTKDYCRSGDPVCAALPNSPQSIAVSIGTCARELPVCQHTRYVSGGQVAQGAAFLAGRAR